MGLAGGVGVLRDGWTLVGLGERVFFGYAGITEEGLTTVGADQGRVSSRLRGWESIEDDIFNPIGMVT